MLRTGLPSKDPSIRIDCPIVRRRVAMTHECEAGTRPMADAKLTELMSP
ncbi:hypothetical protein [Neoroseomonas soli]|uniref:Uncharacterized protein n=1 Tax=Neoroseomonas soli TaxID=1081025 RepID=A0A9X9WUH1_9PROT|nr:hypothetical protein [Neoroseomonas soli]MBR0670800.1 hypothetical protein [Neoroseomonas soli]